MAAHSRANYPQPCSKQCGLDAVPPANIFAGLVIKGPATAPPLGGFKRPVDRVCGGCGHGPHGSGSRRIRQSPEDGGGNGEAIELKDLSYMRSRAAQVGGGGDARRDDVDAPMSFSMLRPQMQTTTAVNTPPAPAGTGTGRLLKPNAQASSGAKKILN